jgi:hypothetical protein
MCTALPIMRDEKRAAQRRYHESLGTELSASLTTVRTISSGALAVYLNGQNPLAPEEIRFDKPANLVRPNVAGFGGTATLTAFDANGAVVGTASVPLGDTPAPLEAQSASYTINFVILRFDGWRLALEDEYGEMQPNVTALGQVIQLKAFVKPRDCSGHCYRVTATATDIASQQRRVSRWVLVPRWWQHCRCEYGKLTSQGEGRR